MAAVLEEAFRKIAKERGVPELVNKENLIPLSVVQYAVDLEPPRSSGLLSIEVILLRLLFSQLIRQHVFYTGGK